MAESIKRKLAGLLVAVTLSGCGLDAPYSGDPDLGVAVPPSWVAGGNGGAVRDRWWEEFRNRELNQLVIEALAYNHDLNAAAARVRTASAEARIAAAALAPTLDAGLDGSRNKQVIDGAGPLAGAGPAEFISNSFGVSLNTSWEVDLWGRVRKTASAATADLRAVEADYAARALSLAGQTAKAWFSLTEARQQLELAERTLENFRKTRKQASDRADVGIQSPTDKHLAISNAASAEALVEQRRESVARTSRQLETLVGRYPAGSARGGQVMPPVPRPPPAGLPAELIRRRPDLIAAERRLAAANQRVGAARASLYPRLSLTANGGTSSSEFGNLLDGDFGVWSIAGNVVQPIFQGGRLRAQVQSAAGRRAEAAEIFAQQALDAYREVETALAVESILARREDSLKRAADSAEKAAQVGSNRYDQGVENFIVVLESQRRALDAESALISARRARLENRIDLHLALGGGF